MASNSTELLPLQGGSLAVSVTPRRSMFQPGEPILMPHLGEYRIYDAVVYDLLTRDEVRNRLYEKAVERYAPGAIAIDIGTGRDINWAHACIKAGALRVYAIEELGEGYDGARATIARLGLEDRIKLVQGNSSQIELPERVNLCVSEIIGGIGSAEGAPAILRDARQRLMVPGGKMIPERCMVRVSAVELPGSIHQRPALSYGWATYLDRVFDQVGHPFDVRVHIESLPESSILSTDDVFEDFDFSTDVISAESHRVATLRIERDGRIDGLVTRNLLWCLKDEAPLDAFHQGGSFSPSPFFPIFYPGIDVLRGDTLEVTCDSRPSDDGVLPDYRITGTLRRASGTLPFEYTAAHHEPRFRSNPFYRALFPVRPAGS
jgi:protein arginine N-methyltransferase 1